MPYVPYKGACVSIPYNDIPHLFVVLNDPCKDGQCLMVMVTSVKEGRVYDATCTLDVGDHPYVNKKSYLLYRMADTQLAAHVSKMVESNYYELKDDMSAEVLERIARGLFDSEETKLRVIKYANSVGV